MRARKFMREWEQLDGAQQWRLGQVLQQLHDHQQLRGEAMEHLLSLDGGSDDELAKARVARAVRRVRELEHEHQHLRARIASRLSS